MISRTADSVDWRASLATGTIFSLTASLTRLNWGPARDETFCCRVVMIDEEEAEAESEVEAEVAEEEDVFVSVVVVVVVVGVEGDEYCWLTSDEVVSPVEVREGGEESEVWELSMIKG